MTPENPAPIAVGYIRRSKESTTRTVSLEDQRTQIEAYAAAQGWQLADTVSDDGVSGGRRERLERLDARMRECRAQIAVVFHLDRLARDAAALLDWLERAGRKGIELHVVGRGRVEAQSASGYLMAAVEGAVAAHFRKVISEKTRSALAVVRARGVWLGGAPLGFTRQGGRLLPDAEGHQMVAAVLELRQQGLTERAIGLQLDMPRSTVHKVLARDRRIIHAKESVAGGSGRDSACVPIMMQQSPDDEGSRND